jgi:hypothetical protein
MPTDDYYHTNDLRAYLEFPGLHLSSIHIRLFWPMGDRTAAAILKVLYPTEPPGNLDDTTLKKILDAVRFSFENPDSIEMAQDRIPAVTVCMLEWLVVRAASDSQKQSITLALQQILTL